MLTVKILYCARSRNSKFAALTKIVLCFALHCNNNTERMINQILCSNIIDKLVIQKGCKEAFTSVN